MNGNKVSRQIDNSLENGNLHFRLCHLCLHLNESEEDIEECVKCQHIFKDEALMQFWDDNDQQAFSDEVNYPPTRSEDSEEGDGANPYGIVNGLNARF